MAWNGSGVFVRAYNWVADKAASIYIVASRMDGEFDNYKAGLENCLTRDGQNSPSTNISWNSKKITSLANGTAATDAANYGQVTGVTTGNAFRKNLLTNGAFDVWQAWAGGNSIAIGTAARIRTADCWWAVRAGAATGYTCTQDSGGSSFYSMRWERDSGNASTAVMYLAQQTENLDTFWLRRGPSTLYLSFKAKKGAGYTGGNLTADVIRGSFQDENVLDGFTGATTLATLSQTLSTTLTRYTLSVPCDASTSQVGVRFSWTPTGVAGSGDYVTLEEVQLEVASAATDFERLPFADTLARCQRYYQKTFPYATEPLQGSGNSAGAIVVSALKSGTAAQGSWTFPHPVTMLVTGLTATGYSTFAAGTGFYNETRSQSGATWTGVATDRAFTFQITAGTSSTQIADALSLHVTFQNATF